MKKVLSIILMAALSLTMVFGMTGCGGPSEEQTQKMEQLLSKYETIVADCDTEFAKFPKVDDEAYNNQLASIKESLDSVKELVVETRKTFDESKSTYSEEKADEVIASLEDQIAKGETFLKSIKDGVAEANASLEQAED